MFQDDRSASLAGMGYGLVVLAATPDMRLQDIEEAVRVPTSSRGFQYPCSASGSTWRAQPALMIEMYNWRTALSASLFPDSSIRGELDAAEAEPVRMQARPILMDSGLMQRLEVQVPGHVDWGSCKPCRKQERHQSKGCTVPVAWVTRYHGRRLGLPERHGARYPLCVSG